MIDAVIESKPSRHKASLVYYGVLFHFLCSRKQGAETKAKIVDQGAQTSWVTELARYHV